jgi:hypothetical protein
VCGPRISLCSCECLEGDDEPGKPSTTSYVELPEAPGMRLDATVTLEVNDPAARLSDLVTALRRFSAWEIQAPLDRLDQPVLGEYRGTFREVLRKVGTAHGLTVLVDSDQRRVSFLPQP